MAEIGRTGDHTGKFVPEDGTAAVNVVVKDKKAFRTNIAETTNETVNLYLTIDVVTPSIAVNTVINSRSLTVVNAAGILAGHAITIKEGSRHFQSIIQSVVGNTINMASGLDYAFTTAASVRVGNWNLNLDGSIATKTAYIQPPPNAIYEIHEVRMSITDDVAMDSAKFGGITALTNGLLFRLTNGITKNGPLIVNNIGFAEQGFEVFYDDKAPAGLYGVRTRINIKSVFGSVLRINGATGDKLNLLIQDNLTDLSLVTCTVSGNVQYIV